jgi:hypothetical protein
VVAVFIDQNVRQQSGCGQSTFLQTFWQRRDDRCLVKVNAVNVFAPDNPAAQETRGSSPNRSVIAVTGSPNVAAHESE